MARTAETIPAGIEATDFLHFFSKARDGFGCGKSQAIALAAVIPCMLLGVTPPTTRV
jgi:hypothetical protein